MINHLWNQLELSKSMAKEALQSFYLIQNAKKNVFEMEKKTFPQTMFIYIWTCALS